MADKQKEVLLAQLETKAEEYRVLLPANYQQFATEYVIDNNGTRAAIAAGFAEKGAHVTASRLLRNPKVKSYIDTIGRISIHSKGVTLEQQLWRMQAISEADITNYVKFEKGKITFKDFSELTPQQTYAIESIKMGKNGVELKLYGRQWSIDMINKHLGTYEKDNKQKGEGLAAGVAVLLPDNRRGKVVPNEVQDDTTPK